MHASDGGAPVVSAHASGQSVLVEPACGTIKIIVNGDVVSRLDSARLRTIVANDRYLTLPECAERAGLAAALIEPGRVERSGAGEAVLLWRDEHSEA